MGISVRRKKTVEEQLVLKLVNANGCQVDFDPEVWAAALELALEAPELKRYLHWARASPGKADQYRWLAHAAFKELGFEDDDDLSGEDVTDAIRALKQGEHPDEQPGQAFRLDPDQARRADEWIRAQQRRKRPTDPPATGERFSYRFVPTSIGTVVKVRDELTGEELDLSDYENW